MIRDAVALASLAGSALCVVFVVVGRIELAISLGLGTALGVANFVLLARGVSNAIDRTVAAVEESRRERGDPEAALEPEAVPHRPRGAGGALRMAVVVAVLAAVLLYPPLQQRLQPAGLAVGVIVVLIAASISALRHERARAR